MTADPGDQGRVIHHLPVDLVQLQAPGQPQADQALTQHMLHRLAHAQVGRQRQDGQQFRQAHTRACRDLGHGYEYMQLEHAPAAPGGAGRRRAVPGR